MRRIEQLAAGLGLKAETLRRFCVGWSEEGYWTWPMFDADGAPLGIVRRYGDGAKKIMPGHKAGLYIPVDLPSDMNGMPLPLLIAEGGTDAATGLELGYWTVGRFSCTHGARLLTELVRKRRVQDVVIVADRDGHEAGINGARSLARKLRPYVPRVRIIMPPKPFKDLRAWYIAGAQHQDLIGQIEAAPTWRLVVKTRMESKWNREKRSSLSRDGREARAKRS